MGEEKQEVVAEVDVEGRPPLYEYGIGKFYISKDVLENQPELVRQLMGRCVVTSCEMQYHRKEFEYVAFSPDFEKSRAPYGVMEIHEYLWVIDHNHEAGETTITAKRADKL